MGASGVRTRSEAILAFARVLADLRASVGNPSFRSMAGRSKAISHTTLHEAVRGNRLPSWATTAEFVKACGADPRAYRDRWESAHRTVGQTPTADIPGAAVDDPPVPVADAAAAGPQPAAAPRTRRLVLVAALLLSVAAAGAIGGAAWSPTRHDFATLSSSPPTYRPADCPVRQKNPSPVPPEHEGDQVTFVRDLTLADCTRVGRRQTVRKVWQLKNSGSVEWRGYSLHRIDTQSRADCQTITDIPVPVTVPGHLVEVAVDVTTPNEAGFCFGRFKMVDSAGKVAFPGGRPLNFQLIVDP